MCVKTSLLGSWSQYNNWNQNFSSENRFQSGHFAYICSFSSHGGLPNWMHWNTSMDQCQETAADYYLADHNPQQSLIGGLWLIVFRLTAKSLNSVKRPEKGWSGEIWLVYWKCVFFGYFQSIWQFLTRFQEKTDFFQQFFKELGLDKHRKTNFVYFDSSLKDSSQF